MATPFDGVKTVYRQHYTYNPTDEHSFQTMVCPHCGGGQFVVVARRDDTPKIVWARCVACLKGVVRNGSVVSPSTLPLRTPAGLPEVELRVWNEVRRCLGVQANAAAVMLCRKLLFHIAVTHGLDPKNDKGWAPSFKECTDHLLAEGLITPRMKPWVERIKDVGNEANHEIIPITEKQAQDVAMFTQKLLELAFEMDNAMAAANADVDDPTAGESSPIASADTLRI